jgi:hypothetical protein
VFNSQSLQDQQDRQDRQDTRQDEQDIRQDKQDQKKSSVLNWVLPLGFSVIVAVLGTEWAMAQRDGKITRVEERVTVLETARNRNDELVLGMAQRLSRIEPMIEYLVKKAP